MSQTGETPEFNLWTGPWIGLLRPDGGRVRTGIRDCILASHRHVGLYDPSPLVVAGIHRLLVAVLQAALEPRTVGDLQALAGAGAFPDAPLDAFGERFRKRFGLFFAHGALPAERGHAAPSGQGRRPEECQPADHGNVGHQRSGPLSPRSPAG